MRAIVQRTRGTVRIEAKLDDEHDSGHFDGLGLVVLLGWMKADEERPAADLEKAEEWLRTRIRGLRIFPDEQGRMNLDLAAASSPTGKGGILWVPQFTLGATLESGFRPSFTKAMAPELARGRFKGWCERLRATPVDYAEIFGVFGADMSLSFTNWGPVTIPFEV